MVKPIKFDNKIVYKTLAYTSGADWGKLHKYFKAVINVVRHDTRGTRPGSRGVILRVLANNQYITAKGVRDQVISQHTGRNISLRQAQEIAKQCRTASEEIRKLITGETEGTPEEIKKRLEKISIDIHCKEFD